ncbi:MAG: DUF45 domain-containing protein [Clostridia bacterium]|nr:DUF45 domain-containing protein [Clostridia bacterium]
MIKVIKSSRKTISIQIDKTGEITVKAPIFLSDEKINDYIISKKSWIEKHQNFNLSIINKNADIISKKKVYFMGEIVDFTEDFGRKIKDFASVYLIERTSFLAKKHGFSFKNVAIKNYKSRWGTCYKNKDITLNLKLICLNKNVIDYVILHELCHTVYFNHQKNFHSLLKSLIGNESEFKRELKEKSFILNIDY